MESIPDKCWVGSVDTKGNEILHTMRPEKSGPYSYGLAIILTPTGQLKIMVIFGIGSVRVFPKRENVFRGIFQPFSLKAGGRTYFTDNLPGIGYKLDYDLEGILWIRGITNNTQVGERQVFMSKLRVAAIKRRRDKKREELKKERKKNESVETKEVQR